MHRMLFAVLVCVGLSGCAIPRAHEGFLRGECGPYGMMGGRGEPDGGILWRPEPLLPPGCEGRFSPRPKPYGLRKAA